MGLEIPKRFNAKKELGWLGMAAVALISSNSKKQLYKAEAEVDGAIREVKGAQVKVDDGNKQAEEAQGDADGAQTESDELTQQGSEAKGSSADAYEQRTGTSQQSAGIEKENITKSGTELTSASDSSNTVLDDNSTSLQGWLKEFETCQTKSSDASSAAAALVEGAATDAEQDFSALSLDTGAEIEQAKQNAEKSGDVPAPEAPAEKGRNSEYLQKVQEANSAQEEAQAIGEKLQGGESQANETAETLAAANETSTGAFAASQEVADKENAELSTISKFATKAVEAGTNVANAAEVVSDVADVVKGVSYTVSGVATGIGIIGGGVTTTGGIISAIGAPLCAVFGLGVPVVGAGGTTAGSGVAVSGTAGTIATGARTIGNCADKISDGAQVIYGVGQGIKGGGEVVQAGVCAANGDWEGAKEHLVSVKDTAVATMTTFDKKHAKVIGEFASGVRAIEDFSNAFECLSEGDYEGAYDSAWSGLANAFQASGNSTADVIGTSMEMKQQGEQFVQNVQAGDYRKALSNMASLSNNAQHLGPELRNVAVTHSLNKAVKDGFTEPTARKPLSDEDRANMSTEERIADAQDRINEKKRLRDNEQYGQDVGWLGKASDEHTQRYSQDSPAEVTIDMGNGFVYVTDVRKKTDNLLGAKNDSEFKRGIEDLQARFIAGGALKKEGLEEAATTNVLSVNKAARKHGMAGDPNIAPDCAQLSMAAYSEKVSDPKNPKKFTFGEGDDARVYEEVDSVGVGIKRRQNADDPEGSVTSGEGFAAKTYLRTNRDGSQTVVIAYRGSDDVADVEADKQLLKGKLPAQINSAQYYLEEVRAKYPDAKIVVTGHSLGGCEAEMVASLNEDVVGISFNAVGTKKLVEGHEEMGFKDNGNVTAYVTDNDVISNAHEHVGSTTVTPVAKNSKKGGVYDEHAIQNFTEAETWTNLTEHTDEVFLNGAQEIFSVKGTPAEQRVYTDGSKFDVEDVDPDGDSTNKQLLAEGFDNPPYTPGKEVKVVVTNEDMVFVRTLDGQGSGVLGSWLMPKSEIDGLTPEQIADKYALPQVPKFMCDVTVPAGTKIRIGECNPLFGYKGGGIQYQLMQRISVDNYDNVRRLPNA